VTPKERTGRQRSAPAAGRTRRLALATAAIVMLLPFAACERTEQTPSEAGTEQLPDQQIYNYRLIESEGGVKRWLLESDRMEKYLDREDVELFSVSMEFYREGEYHSTLTSDRGRANLSTKNLFAWGNVVVVTHDGRRLETEELHYDNRGGLIHNDVYNRFTWGDDVMTGYKLEATPDLDNIEIKEQVSAEVQDEAEDEGREH
jgi:LPS export ABC transporter protein LptC